MTTAICDSKTVGTVPVFLCDFVRKGVVWFVCFINRVGLVLVKECLVSCEVYSVVLFITALLRH